MASDIDSLAALHAAMTTDLAATPISRMRMDLLWLDPRTYQPHYEAVRRGKPVLIQDSSGNPDKMQIFDRLNACYRSGELGVADLQWAERVDAVALRGDQVGQQKRLAEAIGFYREALQLAPGCDLYLMNIGNCYSMLGFLDLAFGYLTRASEQNPTSPRILRNLAGLGSKMGNAT